MTLKEATMSFSLTTTWCYISLLLAVAVYLVLGASNTSCPTGFYFNNTSSKCDCDEFLVHHSFIKCNQPHKRAYIRNGVCLMSPTNSNTYSVGYCPLTLGNWKNIANRLHSELPSDPDMLNATMCGPYNREGYLCGKCIDGYGLPVYSHDLKCVNCSEFSTGVSIFMYIIIQFVPITMFFVCAVVFHLNITSGPLLGYFTFCQIYYLFNFDRQGILNYISNHASEYIKVLFKISQTLSELWSLLFFKSLIPPFCISEKLSSVHIQLLTVVPAIYVVVLVITIWVLMDLQARNYKVIRFLWKPFRPFFKHVNITVYSSNAIYAFATFTFLSSTTLVLNMCTLTLYSRLHIINPNVTNVTNTNTRVLYIDPSVVYYSHEHILYLIIAMVPCIFLVFIPTLLLCVYPTRIYRRLSQLISTRKQLAITAFAEALHNCFKNGLNGTRDYRALAGLIVLCLPVGYCLTYITRETLALPTGLSKESISGYTVFAVSFVLSYVRPCKSTLANFSLSYHTFMFGVLLFGENYWYNISVKTEALELTFIIIPLLSHMFVFFWVVYIICRYVRFNVLSQIILYQRITFLSVFRQCFSWRNRYGYQELPDSVSTGNI